MNIKNIIIPLLAVSLCGCGNTGDRDSHNAYITDTDTDEPEYAWPWEDTPVPASPAELEKIIIDMMPAEYDPDYEWNAAQALLYFMAEHPHKALSYRFDMLNDSTGLSIHKSDDNAMMTVSIDTGLGGTCPDFMTTVLFDTGDSTVIDKLSPYYDEHRLTYRDRIPAEDDGYATGTFVNSINTVTGKGGKPLYLTDCYFRCSSAEGEQRTIAMEIRDGHLRSTDAFHTPEGVTDYVSVEYNIPDWYFSTAGLGWDWVMAVNPKNHELYVPLTDGYGCMTDRYMVYVPRNGRMEYDREDAGYWLCDELHDFERLTGIFRNDRRTVRIDCMPDSTFRYAAWKKGDTFDKRPELIVHGGRMADDRESISFENNGYTYTVPVPAGGSTHSSEQKLIISHNGKVIQSEKLRPESE